MLDRRARKIVMRYAATIPLYVGFDILEKAFSDQPLFDVVREASRVIVTSASPMYKNPGVLKRSIIKILGSLKNSPKYHDISLFNVSVTELHGNQIALVPTPKRVRETPPIYDAQPDAARLRPQEGFPTPYIYQPPHKPYALLVTGILIGGVLDKVVYQIKGKIQELDNPQRNARPARPEEVKQARPSNYR